ncbi:nocobactin polyketide synthase NbtC [Nocardia sp. KC 131]|uniref:nocobactin polyketide synthase NbtC n=1 Tax=Nocardia arseniciresistens TaxID=3392119 RepID=UPI00398EC10F
MPDYRLPDGAIPVLLSSDSVDGLRGEAAAILTYLEHNQHVVPDQVADMLFRTRTAKRRRALAMVTTRTELMDALRSVAADTEHPMVVSTIGVASDRRIGFVFPGQGSQRPGMGKMYYAASPAFRAAIEECAAIFEDRFGHAEPLRYLLGDEGQFEDSVRVVQPALMFQMSGLAAMWQAAGVAPAATIGHSQGELAAGAVSRIMTLRDSVLAVAHRAMLVDRISPRGFSMAVLGMDRDQCEALLARHSGWAELSVVNSPHILAISGDRDTIVDMVATANAKGQFAKEIRVAYPAHTSIVSEYRDDLEAALNDEMSGPNFLETEIPCYGATLGEAIGPHLAHSAYWYWNLRNRVRFDRAIVAASADVDTFIEIAEHPMLQLAIQENIGLVPHDPALPPRDFRVAGTSLRTAVGLGEFTRNLATIAVHDLNYRWEALRVESNSGTARLPLRDFPNTVLSRQQLWAPYQSAPTSIGGPESGDIDQRPTRLAENWVRLERRSLVAPRTLLVVDHTGRCGELASALCTAAYNHGASATAYDPDRPAVTADYDSVVVLLPELPDMDGPAAVRELADFYASRWLPAIDSTVGDCWLLTVGGESVVAEDPAPHLFNGAVSAGFRCIGLEHIGTAFRHLDLGAGDSDAPRAAAIVRALHTKDEAQLALRVGGLYAKRLEVDSARPTEAPDSGDLEHVVIVGGTGTLGLKFAEYLAGRGAGRITLLSRSGETEAIAGRLRAVREIGHAEVVVAACDVSDESSVRRLAAGHADLPATMLVHAAVNYVSAELADITTEKVLEMASSKIIGTDHLLRLLPLADDCRVIICSSAAAVFGGRGQILYATVNRMLDVLACRLRASGTNAVAVQWGIWDLEGPLHAVGLDRITAAGGVSMSPRDALAVGFTEHAEIGRPGNRLVMAADWAQLSDIISAVGWGALLTDVLAQLQQPTRVPVAVTEPVDAQRFTVSEAGAADVSLSDQVLRQLGKVMGTEGLDTIDSSVPLVALGLDSLQALDFRKRVQAELNRDLPVAAILGGASLDDVVRLMAGSNV